MSEKAKKILGMICLIFSGFLLIGEVSVLVIPAMAEIAKKSLGDHLTSWLMVCFTGAVGIHLRRARVGNSTTFALRLIVFAVLLTPLMDIQIALKAKQEYGAITLLPGVRIASVVLSLVFIAFPYVFGRRIFQSKRLLRPPAKPHFAILIIGLACAVAPATVAFFSTFAGLPTGDLFYFVALSYLAAAVWLIWWHQRYSKPARRGLIES